jgi:hypothetical protein
MNDPRFVTKPDGRRFIIASDNKEYPCRGYVGEVRIGYLCSTDFDTELGFEWALGPNKVFATLEGLVADKPCVKECGYVKVIMVALEYGEVGGIPE